jgi:hypothetical protein
MFKRRYPVRSIVKLEEILPTSQIDTRQPVDWILDRTFFRPRDAIVFMNECLRRGEGRSKISIDVLRSAESVYSSGRMLSLEEEWAYEYPMLRTVAALLSKRNGVFPMSEIREDEATNVIGSLVEKVDSYDPMVSAAKQYVDTAGADYRDFSRKAVCMLYQTGMVGVKLAPHQPVFWSYQDAPVIAMDKLGETVDIHVHKTFWQALNVTNKHQLRAAIRSG